MSSRIRYRLEYWGARVFASLARIFPLRVGWFMGALLGQLAFSVIRIRRGVTLENLSRAFGDHLGEKELAKIGAKCYRNFGRSIVEFCRFPKLTRKNLGRMLEIQGLEHCHRAQAQGKGIIILSGHLGAWEYLSPAFVLNGFAVDLFVRSLKNPLADELLFRQRRWVGAEIIRTSRTPKGVLRSLRQNRLMVMLADQDGGRDGVFIPFMDHLASTPSGVARFALQTGAPILMGFVVRQPHAPHRLIIDSPMEMPHSGDQETDVRQILETYTRRLESYLRAYPDQWFWPHRRWKTRPPNEISSAES